MKSTEETRNKERQKPILWLMGLLAVVPLGAVFVFVGTEEGSVRVGPSDRPALSAKPVHESDASIRLQEQASAPDGLGGQRLDRTLRSPRQLEARERLGSPPPDQVGETSNAADRTASEQLARFDANALRFEQLLNTWEAERAHRVDDERTRALSELVESDLVKLEPTVRTEVECTQSVCVVEVSSDLSVGTLIARLAGWLHGHEQRATGDPADPDDDRSFRLVFEADKAPRLPPN